MPYFSETPEDLAFELMMQHKPNFEPDAPEAIYIQAILDRQKKTAEERKEGNDLSRKTPPGNF